MEFKVILILYFLLLQVITGSTNAAKNQKNSPEKVNPLNKESKIYDSQQPGKNLIKDSDDNSSSVSRIKRQYIYRDRYYPLPIFVGGGFGYRGFGGRGFGVRGFGGRAFGGRGFGGGFGGRGFGGRGVGGRGFGGRGIGGRGIGGRGLGGRGGIGGGRGGRG